MAINTEALSAGPGFAPDPWNLVSAGTIAYDGAVLVPHGVTGGSMGAGTLNISALFIQGINIATTLASYLPLAGGTLTGSLNVGALANLAIPGGTSGFVLSTNGLGALSWIAVGGLADAPSNANFYGRLGGAWVIPTHTAISDWTATLAGYLATTGGTLTGALTLAASPTTALGAATKQYVDNGEWVGFTNKFRNANFDVWQRGTVVNVLTGQQTYTADGWILQINGSAGDGRLQWDGPTTNYGMRIDPATTATTVNVSQRIESSIAASLGGNQVTIQALVFNNTSGNITPTLSVFHATAVDNFTSTTSDLFNSLQLCPAGVVTKVAYTFALPQASALLGIQVTFGFPTISTGFYYEITQCDIRATPGVVTGLNANPPPVELRPIAVSLAECQRYYETSYANLVAPGTAGAACNGFYFFLAGLASGSYSGGNFVTYKVEKRVVGTVTVYSPVTGAAGFMRNITAPADVTATVQNQTVSGFMCFPNSGITGISVNTNGAYSVTAEL